jgi:outer membrane protein assembly factor BamE (lipoprotein component of BamABCDE complex)
MRASIAADQYFRALSLVLAALALMGLLGGTGCFRHPEPPASSPQNLTVGKVQGEIKVGMPASDVAMILGSPNIVTTDEQRREVWIYDKVSSESVDTSSSAYGTLIIVGASSKQRQRSETQRTLTVVIKYDENKLVRDFSYNYSQF